MQLKGTKSEKNLRAALAGESIARNKYTYYADAAKKEGLTDTAELFETMAKNETYHAKAWFDLLNEDTTKTEENLKDAMNGENAEWRNMYPEFSKTAREEGLDELADTFDRVAAIEASHERQFMEEFFRVKAKQKSTAAPATPITPAHVTPITPVAVAAPESAYRCMFCGHAVAATDSGAPVVCPVCKAIGAFEHVMLRLI